MNRGLNSTQTNGKSAKLLSPELVDQLLTHVADKRHGTRNRVMILLSFKAGLRACEIARLDWSMVTESGGSLSHTLDIRSGIAKMGSGRRIPCHKLLYRALNRLHRDHGKPVRGPICTSERGGCMTAKGVVNWFGLQYRELGLDGCSSHSGRRTMITMAARCLAKSGGSLRDIQELAGHRAITTTERYIVGDREAQRRLIEMI